MKYLFLFLSFTPCFVLAQTDSVMDYHGFPLKAKASDSVVRYVTSEFRFGEASNRDSFEIVYHFCKDWYWDTLVGRAAYTDGKYDSVKTQRLYEENYHYNARINIYLIQDGERAYSLKPIDGVYVPGTCFEDEPLNYVIKAALKTN